MKSTAWSSYKTYLRNGEGLYMLMVKLGMKRSEPDEVFLRHVYKAHFGRDLDLEHPRTFNEKLQWLKLHDRKPLYTSLVDKYEVKEHVARIIGNEFIIPTFGVWNRTEEIDWNSLPNQFVLKCTHDSASVLVCRDKRNFNFQKACRMLSRALRKNFYWRGREWPYKNVKPRIIAEQYIEDDSSNGLTDYKFMCFDGKVKCSFVCTERFSKDGLKVTFYDRDWKKMPLERHYPSSKRDIPRPNHYEKMIELAERLSKGIPFVRVDFYETHDQIYFGELTLYPGNGAEEFTPEEWDYTFGSWLTLPDLT